MHQVSAACLRRLLQKQQHQELPVLLLLEERRLVLLLEERRLVLLVKERR
jgi:hypothetical protein